MIIADFLKNSLKHSPHIAEHIQNPTTELDFGVTAGTLFWEECKNGQNFSWEKRKYAKISVYI
jgi:hypothetical protein